MDASEFAKGYPRLPRGIERRQDNAVFEQAENYSVFFGELLHDALSGTKTIDITKSELQSTLVEYIHFVMSDLLTYENKLFENGKDYGYKRISHFSSHWINASMATMWSFALFPEDFTAEQKKKRIYDTQDVLAYEACCFYRWKDDLASRENEFAYLSDDMADMRETIEGRLSEFDAAIVLLDFAKRNTDCVVLPGPMQFERLAARTVDGNRNADFIIFNTRDHRAIGVQVKSFFQSTSELARYDTQRIVCVDSSVDLQNRRAIRYKNGSTHVRSFSWAGMIAEDHLRNIRTTGQNATILSQHYRPSDIIARQIDAKFRLGKLKVNRPHIANIIGERILKAL